MQKIIFIIEKIKEYWKCPALKLTHSILTAKTAFLNFFTNFQAYFSTFKTQA